MMTSQSTSELPTTVLRARHGWSWPSFRELLAFRELAYFLVWRDLKVRYKQTALGVTWVVLQPLLLMLIFTLIFGVVARIPSEGIPYPVFVYTALIPWQLFSYALTEASGSIVANERLITKVYFPRVLIPLASVLGGLVDVAVTFVLLLVLMAIFAVAPSPAILLLPAFLALAICVALGVGLWLAALNVQFRDVRYTLPFLTQIWLLATPIVYPTSLLPEPWRALVALNPMAAVVEGFRWAALGTAPPTASVLVTSVASGLVVLVTGALYFRRTERDFADVI